MQYKEKKATPLVFALKEYIQGLTLKFVQLKSAFDKQNRNMENLNNRLESAKTRADKNDYGNTRYSLLEKIMGKDKIDRMIALHEKNQLEQLEISKKISTKIMDNKR